MNKSLLGLIILSSIVISSVHAKVEEKIVAVVNEQIITLSDTEDFRRRLQTGGLVDESMLRLTDPELLKKDREALLNHMINEKLVDSEVKHKGMEVTIERVEQEIRTIAKTNGMSREQLRAALQGRGVSMSRYQDFLKTSLERQSLVEREVVSKIRISDEDVSSYYLAKKGPSGAQVFEYALSHILFLPSRGGDAGALSRARAVLDKIKSGQSFDKMAEQYSEDPNFSKGGQLGEFRAGEMLKEFENAVRGLGPGKVTGVVKSPMGFHLIRVNKRTLVSDPQLEEQRGKLREELHEQAFKRQFAIFLNQRRDEAFIRINGF